MEHSEGNNQHIRTIESTIRRLELSQLLLVAPSGVQLYERLLPRHAHENSQLVLLDEAPSIESLIFPQDTVEKEPSDDNEPKYAAPEHLYSRLMQPGDVIGAAEQLLELREQIGDTEETVDCFHCERYGRTQPSCYFCQGTGLVQPHPKVRIMNHLTNQHADITLDIPKLLVENTVQPDWELTTSTNGNRIKTIGALGISLTPLFTKTAQDIGVDTDNAAVVGEANYLNTLESQTLRPNGLHIIYDHATNALSGHTISSRKEEPLTPLVVLGQLESHTIRNYNAGLFTGHDNEQLARRPLDMRPLRSIEQSLDDLMTAVYTMGGHLWVHWDAYIEGHAAIGFTVTAEGREDMKLSYDEDIRLAIENSWVRLQRICDGLEEPS